MADLLPPQRERLLLWVLMGINFTSIVDFMIMMPLADPLMREFGIGPAQFGLLVSAYSVGAAVAALVATSVADRFDRRLALLVLYAGLMVATLACALATGFNSMLLARTVAGVFGGVLGSVVFAIAGDVIPLPRRGQAMGIIMMSFSFAAVAGVPLGLILAAQLGWRWAFAVLAGVSLLMGWVAFQVVPPVRGHLSTPQPGGWLAYRELLSVPNHGWAFLTSGLVMFAGFSVIPYIAPSMVANAGRTQADMPWIYLVGGAATLISRPIIARLTDRYRHAHVLAVLAIGSMLPIVLITHTLPLTLGGHLVVSALFFILVSGRFVPTAALVTASTQPAMRGRLMAFNSAVQSLASGTGALVAGWMLEKTADGRLSHYDWVGYMSCAVSLLAVAAAQKTKAVS